jgi:hypothetical protein
MIGRRILAVPSDSLNWPGQLSCGFASFMGTTGLPLEQGARCWRRCWRWRAAYGVQHSVIIALPLGHPRGNLRELNFLSGQLSEPRRPALGLPLGRAGEVESEESPTGRVPTRTPHTSRKGASPAARMAPWALAWLPAVTPRSPSRPSRPTKNAKRAARRHSVPPLAAPLPERNPEVLTAALSCWNWLIAATPRQQLGRISPAYSAKWLNNLKSIIPMEEDTGRVWQSDAVRRAPSRLHVVSDFLHWEFGRRPVGELPFSEPMGGVARQGKKRPTAGYRSR